jgi:hypothetical protein
MKQKYIFKKIWETVIHACNPRSSKGRDQEVHSLKPAWVNGFETLSQNHKSRARELA